jgi:hypothetical protein
MARLGRWHVTAIIAALVATALTGVLWFIRHDLIASEPDEVQRLLLAGHGVAAYAAVLVFGSVLALHVRAGWRSGRNVASGIVLATVMTILSVTALWLYYGGEESRDWARCVHIGAGLLGIAAAPVHVALGWRLRRRASRRSVDGAPDLRWPVWSGRDTSS